MNKDTIEMIERLKRLGVKDNWRNGVAPDTWALRRISMQLHRWHELECGVDAGGVERDEATGKCYWYSSRTGRRSPHPDRETGALKRLANIMSEYPELLAYVQSDPRGAALYLVPRTALGDRDIESCYSSLGVAIYK